jgi:hypothetical protein
MNRLLATSRSGDYQFWSQRLLAHSAVFEFPVLRSRSPIKVLLSIESSSFRASSNDSTEVLPRLTTYLGREADTEVRKQFVFTTDHVHPRSRGGRGRANKVPACKYCNSHKSSRSVEEFREWVQTMVFDQATHARAPGGKYVPRRWKIKSETVVFYFELARLLNGGLGNPVSRIRKIDFERNSRRPLMSSPLASVGKGRAP